MNNLSQELKKLQHDILHEVICLVSNHNVNMRTERNGNGINVYFTDFDKEAWEAIGSLKMELIENGIWFDSGFSTQSVEIEWNLDWSLSIEEE